MHLKKMIKKKGKFFISHFVIADAIDGSYEYLERLTIENFWRYLYVITCYIYWEWKDKRIQEQKR